MSGDIPSSGETSDWSIEELAGATNEWLDEIGDEPNLGGKTPAELAAEDMGRLLLFESGPDLTDNLETNLITSKPPTEANKEASVDIRASDDTDTDRRAPSLGRAKDRLPKEHTEQQASDTSTHPSREDIPSVEEVEDRYEKLPRDTFITARQVVERLNIHGARPRGLPSEVIQEGILLVNRLAPREDDGPINLRYSNKYVAAAHEHAESQGIDSSQRALRMFASSGEGRYLAWGIRAEYRDAVRDLGRYLLVDEARVVTGLSNNTLFRRGLADLAKAENGRQIGLVSTADLLEHGQWLHQAFEGLSDDPRQVGFYNTQEVAEMLGAKQAISVERLVHSGLLPALFVDAQPRNSSGIHKYARIPAPDAKALRDFVKDNARYRLHSSVAGFIRQNPNHFTTTRGQFEAYLHTRLEQGLMRTKTDVAKLIGASAHYFYYYDLATTEDALQSLRWNGLKPLGMRATFEVDRSTTQQAVYDVRILGIPPSEVAVKYGVSHSTLYNWMRADYPGDG